MKNANGLTPIKKHQWEESYMCTGEDYGMGCQLGFIGEIKPLLSWLMLCFPGYEEAEIKEKFSRYPKANVINYIRDVLRKEIAKL